MILDDDNQIKSTILDSVPVSIEIILSLGFIEDHSLRFQQCRCFVNSDGKDKFMISCKVYYSWNTAASHSLFSIMKMRPRVEQIKVVNTVGDIRKYIKAYKTYIL